MMAEPMCEELYDVISQSESICQSIFFCHADDCFCDERVLWAVVEILAVHARAFVFALRDK